jgi:hypothetical protein
MKVKVKLKETNLRINMKGHPVSEYQGLEGFIVSYCENDRAIVLFPEKRDGNCFCMIELKNLKFLEII